MRLNLLLVLSLPIAIYAQNSIVATSEKYPNTFSSGSSNVQKFDNSARKFNDWAISVGGGSAFMSRADLTSFYNGRINWGWNAYISLDKQISHTFGISLQYQKGETNQRAMLPGTAGVRAGVAEASTKFQSVSVLGDVNLTNLLRRVDNHSYYRWNLHGYAGIGFIGYDTYLTDNDLAKNRPVAVTQDLGIESFYTQIGVGLKYKLSKRFDLELRTMYILSGDEEIDGGGWTRTDEPQYNLVNDAYSDNLWMVNLGVSVKLGKHLSHLEWHDPLQSAYQRIYKLENSNDNLVVCEKGDADNDGVCDDWDRELNTPAGARVDGAGVALDMDLDGVIDLYDKCVTTPGSKDSNGCPVVNQPKYTSTISFVEEINKNFEGVEFELNSDKIRPISFGKLDNAASIIKTLDPKDQYLVIGATDTRGSDEYNKKLSQKRADAVVNYLIGKGVNHSMLTAEGRGKSDLKYPECDPATKCPEWKNEANRRVYFQAK